MQRFHAIAHCRKHAFDLVILPLRNNNLQRMFIKLHAMRGRQRHRLVIKLDA